jgi:hypothetical protein
LVAKEACTEERIDEGKELLQRIVAMLTKLISRFSTPKEIYEESAQYYVTGDIEDE